MIAESLKPLARPIESLKVLPDNPRKGIVEALKTSYERFGQLKPIVALEDGTVIAGNHQLLAARELGWEEIAVNVVAMDSIEAKAFALADNRIGDLGTYDDEYLVAMLREVAIDPELLQATGYDEGDLDALLELMKPPDLDDLADIIGEPTAEDELRRVVLMIPPDLEEALLAELSRIGSHKAAVELWLGL